MKPFHQVANCRTPYATKQFEEKHYGLTTLGTYKGCTISGSFRYMLQPNPRAIYQAYAFKGKALVFIQILQMLIPTTEKRDPLKIKENLARLAHWTIMDRLDMGDFEVGEQYTMHCEKDIMLASSNLPIH